MRPTRGGVPWHHYQTLSGTGKVVRAVWVFGPSGLGLSRSTSRHVRDGRYRGR